MRKLVETYVLARSTEEHQTVITQMSGWMFKELS